MQSHQFTLGSQNFSFETGRVALQADGSILLTCGETVLLATVVMGGAREGIDFFPLVVEYSSKYYASGKMKGSRFIKREGRPSDNDI